MALKTKTLKIGGMTCARCQETIQRRLRNTAGVTKADVSYSAGTATVTYDPDILSHANITGVIQKLGYEVLSDTDHSHKSGYVRAAGLLLIIASLYLVLEYFGILNLLAPSQLAQADMTYGMLFVIGLVTSVHCLAMCGGINLSQTLGQTNCGKYASLKPSALYNIGRVISYTVVGFIVGALGSAITFSNTAQGILKLVAGVFMVIMGLNMLGIFPWLRKLTPRMPGSLAANVHARGANKGPLVVGLLNGLMPCGPLQAMQIYALSTGSPFKGALSMLLFSLGTVPLMFGLGALSSLLSKRFARRIMTAGAVLVAVLGLSMLTQGFSLAGIALAAPSSQSTTAVQTQGTTQTAMEGGVQVVRSTLQSGKYPAITVQAGVPVKWIIDAPKGSINGCNNRMILHEYDIEHKFEPGENVVEFTPDKAGKFTYSCWMGMIRGTITVTEAGTASAAGTDALTANDTGSTAGNVDSGISSPVPAGYKIPTENVAVAKKTTYEGYPVQEVTIELTDKGFSPAVVVIQKGLDVQWNLKNSLSGADKGVQLLVPRFATQLQLEKGENELFFSPNGNFDFSTGDNAFYGFVKVVDDVDTADIAAIKEEVSKFETQIWPPETFQPNAGGSDDTSAQAVEATVKDGVQYVTSTLSNGRYEPIRVQQGIPVKWTLNAPSGSLNGCNNAIVIPEYDLQLDLKTGDNLIEFTPDRSGTFAFSCWMGMIRSTITVVDKDGTVAPTEDDGSDQLPSCCG